jgi:hypothetical protein
MADDKAIDRGEKLFELTQEQKQAEKKMRSTGVRRKPVVPPSGPPPRKEDADKRFLIDGLGDWLYFHECENLTATNPERQLDFEFHGRRFRLVLSAPRK